MKDIDKYDKLSRRIDKLDNNYSNTLAELMADVHYIKYKVNKSDNLDYERKQNDIESDKIERLDNIKFKSFLFKFGFTIFSIFLVVVGLLSTIKYLFF